MKTRTGVLSCLVGAIVLSAAYEYSRAEPEANETSLKIGVVSIRKIFEASKRVAGYRREALADQEKIRAKLRQLADELEVEKEGLKTLKVGSGDYLAQRKEILNRQAALDAEQGFYKEQMGLKEQKMTSELYEDILRETTEVAKRKGLHLVFERSEADLSGLNLTQLELTMATHKLLYSDGCVDITDEVIARIDAEESAKNVKRKEESDSVNGRISKLSFLVPYEINSCTIS